MDTAKTIPEPAGRSVDATGSDHQNIGTVVSLLLKDEYVTEPQVNYARRVRQKLDHRKTLLEVLKDLKYVGDSEIQAAIQNHRTCLRIGDLLLELGHISENDLKIACQIQSKNTSKKIGQILLEQNCISEPELIEILSLQLGISVIDPEYTEIDLHLFAQAPPAWYKHHRLIPVRTEGDKVRVAFPDPTDRSDLEAARQMFGKEIIPSIAQSDSIAKAVQRLLRFQKSTPQVDSGRDSVVGVVNEIILAAIKDRASDIHIEPLKDRLRIRFRQDGVLAHYKDYPLEILPGLTNRLKVMCDADIAEKRRHQGGRILFEHSDGQLDLRTSFYSTVHGQKIVLRLLNRKGRLLDIREIGMAPRMLERFLEQGLQQPSGVLMVTGPTGSGKTTTIYSCISAINSPQISIATAEEPVEAYIDGVAQCSIEPKINLTFEETLRHIVRQDPDVIVIGEIRDSFSAKIAVQAALTGHQVLTTFHTEDSVGGLLRLMNMDIEPFMVSSTVTAVLAQRLLRRYCRHCHTSYRPSPADLRRLGYQAADLLDAEFAGGQGCPQCRHTGYNGRAGVFELLIPNEVIRSAVLERKSSQELRKLSIEATELVTLFEDGLAKAAAGITTLDEVFRCLPRLHKTRQLKEIQRMLGL
ncbi:MAG TPA: GspE/PulE family protein [Desulfobacterales bacterium]